MKKKKPKKVSQRALNPYYGEFLVSPIPLELSGSHCSHNCYYCFANLGQPGAQFDKKRTYSMIDNRDKQINLPSLLLREKYPILISNRSDPFSHSSYQDFVPLIRHLTEQEIPVAIQTRGGEGIEEVLSSFFPQSVWYISVTHQRDETRQKVEPYAPTIESRLRLVERLRELGHRVLVGVNPLVKEWIPDPETFFCALKRYGVEGIWIEFVHLAAHRQRANLSSRRKEALGEELLQRAKNKKVSDEDNDFRWEIKHICDNLDIPLYSVGQPFYSRFFNPFHETYEGKTLLTTQDFLNHCIDERIEEFGKEEWLNFLSSQMPSVTSKTISSFLYSILRYNRRDCATVIAELGRPDNYRDLLETIWDGQKFSCARFLGCEAFEPILDYSEQDLQRLKASLTVDREPNDRELLGAFWTGRARVNYAD